MRSEYLVIAGGNKTCLVWDCPEDTRHGCAKTLLKSAEQVGFVSEGLVPRLTMMGGELCIDGIFALASRMDSQEGVLYASGVQNEIQFVQIKNDVHITLELQYEIQGDVVLFDGIGFLCNKKNEERTKKEFKELCKKYSVPAFGIITYEENKIIPWVYVEETDSLILESACGSGSIALHLITGLSDILQPTGELISVAHIENTFSVRASVCHVDEFKK